jgi:NADH-quinone oxidoreductase subunit F
MRNGAEWFKDLGTGRIGGTAIFSVSGHVEEARQLRAAAGHPVPELLELCGGVRGGRKLKAVIPGGSSVPVLPANDHGLHMDYDSLARPARSARRGGGDGRDHLHGADAGADLALLHGRVLRPVHAVPRGYRLAVPHAHAHSPGRAEMEDLDMLVDVANKIEGHTICALGDAAAWPVQSFLKHFRHEFEYMIEHGGRSIVDAAPSRGLRLPRSRMSDDTVNIEVDGKPLQARKGARCSSRSPTAGIYVPRFCYHPKLSSPPTAACAWSRSRRRRSRCRPARRR